MTGHGGRDRDDERWTEVLELIDTVAAVLDLSGWCLSVHWDAVLHTCSCGTGTRAGERYVVLDPVTPLPGPVTFRTGIDQYFNDRLSVHELYPATRDVGARTSDEAAAVLCLKDRAGAPSGYLELRFDVPVEFDDADVRRLEVIAANVSAGLPVPGVVDGPDGGPAHAMRRHALAATGHEGTMR